MKDDAISRQAAIDGANKIPDLRVYEYCSFLEMLYNLPSVPERKGRWVELYDSNYKCSECGSWWHSDDMAINEEFRYCPTCGARMEGAEEK